MVGSRVVCAGHQPSFISSSGQFALVNSEDALYCGNKFLANPKVVVVVFVSEMKKKYRNEKMYVLVLYYTHKNINSNFFFGVSGYN